MHIGRADSQLILAFPRTPSPATVNPGVGHHASVPSVQQACGRLRRFCARNVPMFARLPNTRIPPWVPAILLQRCRRRRSARGRRLARANVPCRQLHWRPGAGAWRQQGAAELVCRPGARRAALAARLAPPMNACCRGHGPNLECASQQEKPYAYGNQVPFQARSRRWYDKCRLVAEPVKARNLASAFS